MTSTTALTQTTDNLPAPLAALGEATDRAAARNVFADYQGRRADNTLRAQRAALAVFADFLADLNAPVDPEALYTDPAAWRGLSWGTVATFQQWQLGRGDALATINLRLATVKVYARLAAKAGALSANEYALIKAVEGYTGNAGRQVNEKRSKANVPTRQGRKKAEGHTLGKSDARRLLTAHDSDTPQGRRDALLFALLLEHGLRCGEVAALEVAGVDLAAGELTFYRPKVGKTQVLNVRKTRATWAALQAYMAHDAPAVGPLLRSSASKKDGQDAAGQLTHAGMSERAITKRVQTLGRRLLNLANLSAHDLRHTWATLAARAGTDPFALQEAGGWNSLAMPRRYVEAARVANEGVVLPDLPE